MSRFFKTVLAISVIASFSVFAITSPYRHHQRPESSYKNSVVRLLCGEGVGTGTLIDQTRVLTARHVVEGVKDCSAKFVTGKDTPAHVVWVSSTDDLAILQIEPTDQATPLPVSCRAPVEGEEIRVIGMPLDVAWFVYTWGHVAGGQFNPKLNEHDTALLDLTVYPGNSGGPVIDNTGHVIGVLVAMYVAYGVDGMSVMVPSSVLCAQKDV